MMSKTFAVPAAVVAPTPANPAPAGADESRQPLFAPRPRRLATGPVPAAFIVLVWVLLWAWVSLGVATPLSRLGGPERVRVVQAISARA